MNTDDPRLTAYLHGEMTPEERARFETELKNDRALAEGLAHLRRLDAGLHSVYERERVPGVTPEPGKRVRSTSPRAREARIARLKADAPKLVRTRRTNFGAMAGALAAALALAGLYAVKEITEFAGTRENDNRYVAISPATDAQRNRPSPLAEQIAEEVAKAEAEAAEEYETVAHSIAAELEQAMRAPGLPADQQKIAEFSVPAGPDMAFIPPLRDASVGGGESGGSPQAAQTDLQAVAFAPPATHDGAPGGPSIRLTGVRRDQPDERPRVGQYSSPTFAAPPSYENRMLQQRPSPIFGVADVGDAFRRPIEPPRRSGERYPDVSTSGFLTPLRAPLSTFAAEVDTAGYTNVRRILQSNQLPPAGAVRLEELINYFDYAMEPPSSGDVPFSVALEIAEAPWEPRHHLVRIGLKGHEIPWHERPASNLVFLIDVSGSMSAANKLPLVKQALGLLVQRLDERDRVSIVTYAGAERTALPPTSVAERARILDAISALRASGSTNGSGGIQRAYGLAREHLLADGNNRVILCSDGDFNVGITDPKALTDFIAEQAADGIFLSVFGFGGGNYRDDILESLSHRGDGNYAYIDDLREARRVFVQGAAGTLMTIAKDVKIQTEFNPAKVAAYRLLGYENRALPDEAFNDDRADAGEIGSGHSVTALYEIVPVGAGSDLGGVDELRYQVPPPVPAVSSENSDELLWLKLRYKEPRSDTSRRIEFNLNAPTEVSEWRSASPAFRWAASVAGFGMQLRNDPHRQGLDWNLIEALARSVAEEGEGTSEQLEFLSLVDQARRLAESGAR